MTNTPFDRRLASAAEEYVTETAGSRTSYLEGARWAMSSPEVVVMAEAIKGLYCGSAIVKESDDQYSDCHLMTIDKDDWQELGKALAAFDALKAENERLTKVKPGFIDNFLEISAAIGGIAAVNLAEPTADDLPRIDAAYRDLIRKYMKLKAERDGLKVLNDHMQTQYVRDAEANDQLRAEVEHLTYENAKNQSRRQEAEAELQKVRDELIQVRDEKENQRVDLDEVKAELKNARQHVANFKREYSAVNVQLQKVRDENERMMATDYWFDRYKITLAESARLHLALERILGDSQSRDVREIAREALNK